MTNSFSPVFSWLTTPFLKCFFSVFSPSLRHLHLARNIAPLVLYSIIFFQLSFLFLPCPWRLPFFLDLPCYRILSILPVHLSLFSISSSLLEVFVLLSLVYFIDCSRVFSLVISHIKVGFTLSSLTYSSMTF